MNKDQLKQTRTQLLRLTEDYIRVQETYSDEYLDTDIKYTIEALSPGPTGIDGFISEEFTDDLRLYLEILNLVKSDRNYTKSQTDGKKL